MIFKRLIGSSATKAQRQTDRKAGLYRALIRREAKIGGELFGPVPAGHRREFFCLDEHTWIWHEEWTDDKGKRKVVTTRYDVRPDGILKAQDGRNYQRVGLQEALRLQQAGMNYEKRIKQEIYDHVY